MDDARNREVLRHRHLHVFLDHNPPHLHARYGQSMAMYRLSDGLLLRGEFPPTAARLVTDWMAVHRRELEENWRRVLAGEAPEKIVGPDE